MKINEIPKKELPRKNPVISKEKKVEAPLKKLHPKKTQKP